MKRLFIFFLVVVMLVGCGCEATVAQAIEWQDIPPLIKIEEGTEEGTKEESEVNVGEFINIINSSMWQWNDYVRGQRR